MPTPAVGSIGAVQSLWRYPVKSMMGEELETSEVTERGLLGDRVYALVDRSDGRAASAKNPLKWPGLLRCRAAFVEPVHGAVPRPPVRIALPDGSDLVSDQADLDTRLSDVFGRAVTLRAAGRGTFQSESYWPDIDGLPGRDTVTEFELAQESFFDVAVIHLVAAATLERLSDLYPQGRFDARRFRPNIVVRVSDGQSDFVEDAWIGRTVVVGDDVRLQITRPCKRCVMTTLPQADLPRDLGILRTAARSHEANVGVYAAVVREGTVRRGDPIAVE
jgi:MOSC domain-containing protein